MKVWVAVVMHYDCDFEPRITRVFETKASAEAFKTGPEVGEMDHCTIMEKEVQP